MTTPGTRGAGIAVTFNMDHVPAGQPLAASAETGLTCTNIVMEQCGAGKVGMDLRWALQVLERGAHIALLEMPGAAHPLILFQSDRCTWHDRLYPRDHCHEWKDLFHVLGRCVGTVVAGLQATDLGLVHPMGGGWRLKSGGAFLEGLGMALDEAGLKSLHLHFEPHDWESGALQQALEALRAEQALPMPPMPRAVDMEEVAPGVLGVSVPRGAVLRVWRTRLREPVRVRT